MGKPHLVSEFTAQEQVFLDNMLLGKSADQSAKNAKYQDYRKSARDLMQRPKILAFLRKEHEKSRKKAQMTRDKVLDIVTDAVEIARLQADPMAMIRGAGELNKMCGFYAPEEHKLVLTGPQEERVKQLESLSDEDLLKISEAETIDAEFEVLEEDTPDESSETKEPESD